MNKELKACKNPEDLECNENVKHKTKEYIKKYMQRFGAVYRPKEDTEVYWSISGHRCYTLLCANTGEAQICLSIHSHMYELSSLNSEVVSLFLFMSTNCTAEVLQALRIAQEPRYTDSGRLGCWWPTQDSRCSVLRRWHWGVLQRLFSLTVLFFSVFVFFFHLRLLKVPQMITSIPVFKLLYPWMRIIHRNQLWYHIYQSFVVTFHCLKKKKLKKKRIRARTVEFSLPSLLFLPPLYTLQPPCHWPYLVLLLNGLWRSKLPLLQTLPS